MQACLCARKDRESNFHHCGGPVQLTEACLSARKYRESSFHHCRGAVNLVLDWLSTKRYLESGFHHCGGSVKLVQACLCSRFASVPEVIHFLLPCPVSVYHSAPPPQFSPEILLLLIIRNDKEISLQNCMEK